MAWQKSCGELIVLTVWGRMLCWQTVRHSNLEGSNSKKKKNPETWVGLFFNKYLWI